MRGSWDVSDDGLHYPWVDVDNGYLTPSVVSANLDYTKDMDYRQVWITHVFWIVYLTGLHFLSGRSTGLARA